ncbi:conserved unknown protein [Ectocarpus siliculosus]|uniref:Pentacotripeptide-repeat region of PRORP domain-containing protein n=1 Tax=Ectocarpus siliculosus TaxID=2880 RepID=D8LN77_ECTSI|nr:conserved unknown protein [Ectocarpus siliculosus]|eukprot:CBN74840.1 conserved unknown protein [Ectocarpus siliculosus]
MPTLPKCVTLVLLACFARGFKGCTKATITTGRASLRSLFAVRVISSITSKSRESSRIYAWNKAAVERRPKVKVATKTARRDEEEGVAGDLKSSLKTTLHKAGKKRDWRVALQTLDEIKLSPGLVDAMSYNIAITACGGRQLEKALDLLGEMEEEGVTPNIFIFNSAIKACGDADEYEKALTLLDEVLGRGLSPNVITYNAAIGACAKCGRWQKALDLLGEMSERQVVADVTTYNAVIEAFAGGDQWEKALDLLSDMSERGVVPNARTRTLAISACGKQGSGRRLWGYLGQLKKKL